MENIVIPNSYFLKMATIDYSDWKSALIREFIQNSYDADATEIRFHYSKKDGIGTLSIVDNGHGMTEQVIRERLLTLGGSLKKEGSVGGLGKAKEILYFSWNYWNISSQNVFVEGSGSQFTLTLKDPSFIKGVSSTIEIPESIVSEYLLRSKIQYIVSHSCLNNTKVFYNEEEIPNSSSISIGNKIGTIDGLGSLYRNTGTSTANEVVIQSRGLMMFSRYLPGNNNCNYVFNIEVPSYDSLTSNRDSFIYEFGRKFDILIDKLVMNPVHIDTNEKICIPVVERKDYEDFYRDEKFQEAIHIHMNTPIEERSTTTIEYDYFLENQLGFSISSDFSGSSGVSVVPVQSMKITEFYGQYKRMFKKGFIVITDKEVPLHFFSQFLTPDAIATAKLWQKIVNLTYNAYTAEESYPYGIGFTTDSNVAASNYKKYILINLDHILKIKNMDERISEMYLIACHEIAHNTCIDHTQEFINEEEKIMVKLIHYRIENFEEKDFYNKFYLLSQSLPCIEYPKISPLMSHNDICFLMTKEDLTKEEIIKIAGILKIDTEGVSSKRLKILIDEHIAEN